jgi:ParB-like chromosome segregation protein Spo0J
MIIVGLASAGLVGALAANLVTTDQPGSAEPPADLARLEERMTQHEARFERFREEVLERLDAPPLPAPARAALEAVAVESELETPLADAVITEEAIEERVKKVIEEREKASREERAKRFAEAAAARESDYLDRLEKELGLTAYQRGELERIFERRRTAMNEFREKMFSSAGRLSPEERTAMRDEARKLREDTDAEIKELLTPEQYQTFQTQQPSRGGGPFRGGGGGRGR